MLAAGAGLRQGRPIPPVSFRFLIQVYLSHNGAGSRLWNNCGQPAEADFDFYLAVSLSKTVRASGRRRPFIAFP